MFQRIKLDRRAFLGGAAALGIAAPWARSHAAVSPSIGNLPARGSVVIRNAYVITMEPGQADLPNGDVRIENGQIAEIGAGLAAPGAEIIDGRGFIVMPGLVETHWHMWTSLLRNMSGTERAQGYFPLTTAVGKVYTPREMYYGTLLGAAEAIFSGITTVHDWCHNIHTPQHAEEDIRALQETGIRARFCYGPARGMANDVALDTANLERMGNNWASFSNENLLTLGMGWRGVQASFLLPDGRREVRPLTEAVYRKEYDAARKLGIPISVHLNSWKHDRGHVAALEKLGLLFNGLQIVHGLTSTPEEMKALAAAGGSLSVSPFSEMRIGYGVPKIVEYLEAGVTVGLSVDTTPLTGSADMFAIMKMVQNIENGRYESEFKLPPRKVLELATISGAKALGVADRTGSLAKGKRADLIMVDTRGINIGPFTDAAHMLVDSAQPMNVDTVMIDGRILKRGGKLTAIDPAGLVADATGQSRAARDRAKWW